VLSTTAVAQTATPPSDAAPASPPAAAPTAPATSADTGDAEKGDAEKGDANRGDKSTPPSPDPPKTAPAGEASAAGVDDDAAEPAEAAPPPAPKPKPKPKPKKRKPKPKPETPVVVDAGAADGGTDAGVTDAGTTDAGVTGPQVYAAKYHGNNTPLEFAVEVGGVPPHERATKAGAALTAALDMANEQPEKPNPRVDVERGVIAVWIGKDLITQLYPADATAAGLPVSQYAENLDAEMKAFVPAQLRRRAVQLFALHVFLSVFFGVAGFLTLRFLRATFDRWDTEFEDRRGDLSAISVFKIPVFSSEAVGGTIAFGLAIGRVTSYVIAVLLSLGAMLSQFDFTRPILKRLISWSAGPVLKAVEDVVTSVPGLILVAILVVSLRGGLRVMNLLLDGILKKRIEYKPLPPSRVPTFRFIVSTLSVILLAPLLVAAGFGRWGTPWEHLALAVGLAVVIGAIPQIASYVTGVAVVWREGLKPGDWVQVGDVSGEITQLSFHELSLVPEGGGTILIPMLYLVWHPVRRLREPPAVSFDLTVARDRPAKELMDSLRKAVIDREPDAKVECVDICRAWIKVRVLAPSIRPGVREALLLAVSDAVDNHEFELPTLHGPNRGAESL